jgi:hypothetical protein
LFCGTGISLIVEEDFLDEERSNMSAEDFISELVVTRNRLLQCQNCSRIIVLDEHKNEIKYYKLEENA